MMLWDCIYFLKELKLKNYLDVNEWERKNNEMRKLMVGFVYGVFVYLMNVVRIGSWFGVIREL